MMMMMMMMMMMIMMMTIMIITIMMMIPSNGIQWLPILAQKQTSWHTICYLIYLLFIVCSSTYM